MNNQLMPFARGQFNVKTVGEKAGQSMRVPMLSEKQGASLLEWLRFVRTEIDPQVPLFLSASHDRNWVDLLVGEPDPQDFSCLKMNLEGIPMVSEVPYNIPDSFQSFGKDCIGQWQNEGTNETPVLFGNGNAQLSRESGRSGGWLKKLFRGS
jgi:hypothetical protein